METSAQTVALKSLEALVGRLPDPNADREALAALADPAHPGTRRVARRLQSRNATCGRPLRELLPGLDLLRSPLAPRLGARARKCLSAAEIRGWDELAATVPIALRHIPDIGAGTVEEILLLAISDWASGFLPQAGQPGPSLEEASDCDPLLDLIGRSPDPAGDAAALRALFDPAGPSVRRFSRLLRHPDHHQRPLRELLPGLDLIAAPSFSGGLDYRTANALARANLRELSDLAGVSPAQIAELEGVGVGTVESLLAVVIGDWATAYLRRGGGWTEEDAQAGSDGPPSQAEPGDLASAFERLEAIAGFETFKRRRLEGPSLHVRALAAELKVSRQLIYAREARVERALATRMRDPRWPIRIAVEELRARLGSVARPQEIGDAWGALDSGTQALPSHLPHRSALLLWLGEYRVTDEWVLDRDIEELTRAVVAAALSRPSADVDAVARHLSRLGVREELQLPWLISRHGLRIIDGRISGAA